MGITENIQSNFRKGVDKFNFLFETKIDIFIVVSLSKEGFNLNVLFHKKLYQARILVSLGRRLLLVHWDQGYQF